MLHSTMSSSRNLQRPGASPMGFEQRIPTTHKDLTWLLLEREGCHTCELLAAMMCYWTGGFDFAVYFYLTFFIWNKAKALPFSLIKKRVLIHTPPSGKRDVLLSWHLAALHYSSAWHPQWPKATFSLWCFARRPPPVPPFYLTWNIITCLLAKKKKKKKKIA